MTLEGPGVGGPDKGEGETGREEMGIPRISAMAAGLEAASRLERTYFDREEFPSCSWTGVGAMMGIPETIPTIWDSGSSDVDADADAVSKTIGPGLGGADPDPVTLSPSPSTWAEPAFLSRAKREFNPSPAPPISAPSFMARATPIPDASSFLTTLM